MWTISIFFAVLIATTANYIIRTYGIDIFRPVVVIGCIPVVITINYCYWYGYSKASSFIVCWVLTVALGAIMSFFVDLFLLKEIGADYKFIAGIFFIVVGAFLLNWK